jgi:DNA-binding transcriptional LysR family regulator
MVEAAADGLGIAYVPENFAEPMLGSGRLMTVLEDWCPPIPGLMLYYPGNRHVPSTLRAFIDVLREANRILPHCVQESLGAPTTTRPRPGRSKVE